MRIAAPTLLLLVAAGQNTKTTTEAFSFSPSPKNAVSFVKKVMGGAALATSVVASPLVGQVALADVLPVNPGAVVVNVDTSNVPPPVDIAKQLWQHKSQIQAAFNDLVAGAQKAAGDLDGVVSPQVVPKVEGALPANVFKAARDALTGQARVVVNGKPIYVQIDSAQGFLDMHVISPLLPQIPFLEPTAEQKAGMFGYGMYEVPAKEQQKPEVVVAPVVSQAGSSLWKTTVTVPVVNVDLTVEQAAEAALAALVGVYGTSYGYYSYILYSEEQAAKAKKAKLQAAKNKPKKEAPPPPSPPTPPKVEAAPAVETPAKEEEEEKVEVVAMEEPEKEMAKFVERLPEAPKEENADEASLMNKVKRILSK